jgi:hypothetical protein
MPAQIVFVVRGDTPGARAESLDRAQARWEAEGGVRAEDPQGTGLALFVIVTGPTRDTSVGHALSCARSEIEDDIGEMGGTIWDRTHVQVTTTDPRPKEPDVT